jgi:hypothetical protein
MFMISGLTPGPLVSIVRGEGTFENQAPRLPSF